MSWGARLLLDSEQERIVPVGSVLLAVIDIHRVASAVVLSVQEEEYPRQLVFGTVAGLNKGTVRLGQAQEMYEIFCTTTLLMVVIVDQRIGGRDVPFFNVIQGLHENAGVRVCDPHR